MQLVTSAVRVLWPAKVTLVVEKIPLGAATPLPQRGRDLG